MTTEISRRGFLGVLGATGILSLGLDTGCGAGEAKIVRHAERTGDLTPNMYISIKRDGRAVVEVDRAEIGQGVTSMYSTLVAEELDLPLASVEVHLADSLPEYRTIQGMQLTGGSASTKDSYLPVRTAAASARAMLIGAAASRWNVAANTCTTSGGAVVHAASGRRLMYGDLTVDAAKQPVPESPRLKPKSEFTLIGKRATRVDARAKVDGSARFGIDVDLPDMVRAFVIHGPVHGAEALAVHADAARAMPGVLDVFAFPGGVAVVAEKYWQARAAAPHVEVKWSAGSVAGLDTEAMASAARSYRDGGQSVRDDGDAAKAIEHSAHRVAATYEAPFLAHAPMEPQNCTILVTERGAEVWVPCQSPTLVQGFVADALDISPDDVLVHSTLCGGGFGRRIIADFAGQAAHIAKRFKRPVQMIWTRESDMTQGFYRPQLTAKMEGGVDERGNITGVTGQMIGQSIVLSSLPMIRAAVGGVPSPLQDMVVRSLKGMVLSNTVPDPFTTEGMSDTPYMLPNVRISLTPLRSKMPVTFWRSVGHSFTGFAMESFVDELARAGNVDAVDVRRRVLPPGSRARRVLDAVVQMSRWGSKESARPGIGRGIARHESFETEVAEVAEVAIEDGKIRVHRVYVAVDCGVVVNPDIVRAQVEGAIIFGLSAALAQEITTVDGVVQQTNFDTFPLLRMDECPEIVVQILESDAKPTGIGEPGLPPIGPAVANAICDLTGVRLRRLPLQRAWDEAHR